MKLRSIGLQVGLLIAAQAVPPTPAQTGSVTGIVRTTLGAPAANVRVTALREESTDNALRAMASLTQTDSSGRYRLDNVPPGRYYIAAGRVDLPTYYPGTLDVTRGTTISITSAGVVPDIDFIVQDTSAAPAPAGGVGLRGRGTAPAGGGVRGGPAAGANAPVLAPPQIPGGARVATLPGVASRPGDAWWTNAPVVAQLGLTEDQKKKIEAIAERHRQPLAQNKADLEREETALARMLDAEVLETRVITAQSERVVAARAELDRANSKLTLEMRESLSRSQWAQLQQGLQPFVATPATVPGARGAGGRRGGPGNP
jgi:Spy/CpxP family protein refolding chaperone